MLSVQKVNGDPELYTLANLNIVLYTAFLKICKNFHFGKI
jgi:hypothetical protein